jgi:hypothetical protein
MYLQEFDKKTKIEMKLRMGLWELGMEHCGGL